MITPASKLLVPHGRWTVAVPVLLLLPASAFVAANDHGAVDA